MRGGGGGGGQVRVEEMQLGHFLSFTQNGPCFISSHLYGPFMDERKRILQRQILYEINTEVHR